MVAAHKVMNVDGGVPIRAWVDGVELEDEAAAQLRRVAAMPFMHKHVAVMPDVHAGKGATVGSVIATKGAIIPAAVGVDIGCGMIAVRTSLTASQLPDDLKGLRAAIEGAVPHGRSDNGGANDRGAWGEVPAEVVTAWEALRAGWEAIAAKHPRLDRGPTATQLGTLGTGNHFIEVCLDESQAVWVMLHSGSRGVGNRVGSFFIERAKLEMRRWFVNLPDQDLAYLPEGSEHLGDYLQAVSWAQRYAATNRAVMLERTLGALRASGALPAFDATLEAVNCHHNYVAVEDHYGERVFVTRKGAVRAGDGELGIIPGSMGARSFIVRGKGNRESFCSCSHGAGRRMSRAAARRAYTVDDHARAMAGVECRKDEDVIDETPMAYKDIDAVMRAQQDLVEVVHTLKQVLCVKG
jgi:tRNA-splicing ligase RtcB